MTVFLFALAGIPPLGGWFAKFVIFKALADPGTTAGYVLAVIVGVNSVIALFYYARIAQAMWMQPVPDEDRTPIRVPPSLAGALAICCIVVLVLGVAPGPRRRDRRPRRARRPVALCGGWRPEPPNPPPVLTVAAGART